MEYNDDKSRIEDLLESKSFQELTDEEKFLLLKELGSEREYNSLRQISSALFVYKSDLSPDPESLRQLKVEMKRRGQETSWFGSLVRHRVPAYSLAPAMVLLFCAGYFLNYKTVARAPESLLLTRIDTVLVQSPPDTVFVERVVVRYQPPDTAPRENYSVVKNVSGKEKSSEGVSMKDKEELERFLVSGS
jgi:hypothetical protein